MSEREERLQDRALETFNKAILDATYEYRNGPEREVRSGNGVQVVEIYAMPPVEEATQPVLIDVVFMTIGIDPEKADDASDLLLEWCKKFPEPDVLAGGPSYITLGAIVGSQDLALRIMALGQHLGFWDVVTPRTMGFTDEAKIREMAGVGYVMTTGWRDG